MFDPATVWSDVEKIRAGSPLVINITNNVVTNTTANALLALGASPAMSHAVQEQAQFASYAGAVVMNIGTPMHAYVECMMASGVAANKEGTPVVLDPVAAGATTYRNEVLAGLLENIRFDIIRGNASEIMSLAGESGAAKGADSTKGSDEALDSAKALARKLGCVTVISGERDYVTDGERVAAVANGHPMMPRVTGLGCTATAVVGAFRAVNPDSFAAAVNAMVVMGLAGELAAEKAAGPGTLQLHFYDMLYNLDAATVAERCKVEI